MDASEFHIFARILGEIGEPVERLQQQQQREQQRALAHQIKGTSDSAREQVGSIAAHWARRQHDREDGWYVTQSHLASASHRAVHCAALSPVAGLSSMSVPPCPAKQFAPK